MQSGNLNLLEPSGPLQVCNGTALILPFIKWLWKVDQNGLVYPWKWDRQAAPKLRLLTTNLRCVTSQKSENLRAVRALKCGAEEKWRRSVGPIAWQWIGRPERFKGESNILYTPKRERANWNRDSVRWNCLLKHVIEGKIGRRKDEEEDVSSYWMTLKKWEGTGNWRRKHWIALFWELTLERVIKRLKADYWWWWWWWWTQSEVCS
jgi:hypothetical protein